MEEKKSRYNEKVNKATQKYHREHYEQIAIRVPKGKREEFKEIAEQHNISMAQMIVDAVALYNAEQ